ncbi:MAG TPA: hypothetical protein VEA16_21915 [Vicinamibacterales bacterium]|nr:hypothetical protein [Vicinamibacterales bacterium]
MFQVVFSESRRDQEVLDRTLALVGGQPITLSDAKAAVAFGLVTADSTADPIAGVTMQLVDRELILREVQRYAPPGPSDAMIDARLDDVRKRFATAAALRGALDTHGLTESRLRAWIRDNLRSEAYLAQRFASASTPTDAEIAQAYTRARAEFDKRGLSFEQAAPIVRDRLSASRRRELISDWVADLRRRTDVVILQ